MDAKVFIERLLENENLTAELMDEDANWLLNWGSSQVKQLVQDIEDEEAAGTRVNALMAVMRQVNQLVGQLDALETADLAAELGKLVKSHAKAFGGSHKVGADERTAAAAKLGSMTSSQALQFLVEWLTPAEPGEKS